MSCAFPTHAVLGVFGSLMRTRPTAAELKNWARALRRDSYRPISPPCFGETQKINKGMPDGSKYNCRHRQYLFRRDFVYRKNTPQAPGKQLERRGMRAACLCYSRTHFLFYRKEPNITRGILKDQRAGLPQHSVFAGLRS